MKKLIAAIIISIVSVLSFAGCGMVQDAADEMTEMVTDASDAVSEAASGIAGNDDGEVDDDDGIIDNDDNENTNE